MFSYVLLRCGRFDQFSRVAFCSDVLRSGRCVVMRWVQFSSDVVGWGMARQMCCDEVGSVQFGSVALRFGRAD